MPPLPSLWLSERLFVFTHMEARECICRRGRGEGGGGSPNVCLGSICEEEEEEEAKSVRGVCAQSPLYPKPKTNETTNRKRGTLFLSPPPPPPQGRSDRDGRPTRLVCLPTKKAFGRRRWKKIRPPPPPPFPPPFPLSPLLSDDKSLPSEKSTYVCTARAEGVVVWHLQRSSHDPTE